MQRVSNLSIGSQRCWSLPVEDALDLHGVPGAALPSAEAVGFELHSDGPQAQALSPKGTGVRGHGAHVMHGASQVGLRASLPGCEVEILRLAKS